MIDDMIHNIIDKYVEPEHKGKVLTELKLLRKAIVEDVLGTVGQALISATEKFEEKI